MIYGNLKDIGDCKGKSVNLDTAIDFIKSCERNTLVDGRNEIDGENVFLNCFGYKTMTENKCFFEAHRRYLDIHIILSGNELIGVSSISQMTKTGEDVESDFAEYKGRAEHYFLMDSTKFLIAYPEDAHMVKLMDKNVSEVKKAVIKVLI